jgi:hypothetical protein
MGSLDDAAGEFNAPEVAAFVRKVGSFLPSPCVFLGTDWERGSVELDL